MADPLSLTTSILAVLGACSTASKTLANFRALKDARLVVQTLNNEISDLYVVMIDAKEHFENAEGCSSATRSVDSAFLKRCSSTLDRTRDKIIEAESLIQYQLIKAGRETELKIDKNAYWREHGRLGQLKTDIRESKHSIIGLFTRLGVSKISKIQMDLDEVRMNELPRILQTTDRIEAKLSGYLSSQPSQPTQRYRRRHDPSTGGPTGSDLSSIEISVARLTSNVAAPRCSCRRQRTSLYLQKILGSLFMCYTAAPGFHRDRYICPYHRARAVVVHYVFPAWFLRYMMAFETNWSPGGAISCSLTIAQTIPTSHIVYDLIAMEDVNGLRGLLASAQISIEAQSPSPVSGSLLWSAIVSGKLKSIKFFLEMGADLYMNHDPASAPERAAWDLILSKTFSAEWREELASVLPFPNFDEIYDFSAITKAVLGLSNQSIDDAIRAEQDQINRQDRTGRTALTWAAWRGDTEAIEHLLSYKPDLNIQDSYGRIALVYAARRSWRCSEMLLEAGADVLTKDRLQGTLLHHATYRASSGDIRLVKRLVQAEVDINATDQFCQTALLKTNRVDVAEYLISKGAESTFCDYSGNSALTYAVMLNSHGLIHLFMRKGHDHIGTIDNYGTMLHVAAEFGDTRTLRLLARGDLRRRNISIENSKGLTPMKVALQREDDIEWISAFWSLMKKLDENQRPSADSSSVWPDSIGSPVADSTATIYDDSESDVEFVDALDYQY